MRSTFFPSGRERCRRFYNASAAETASIRFVLLDSTQGSRRPSGTCPRAPRRGPAADDYSRTIKRRARRRAIRTKHATSGRARRSSASDPRTRRSPDRLPETRRLWCRSCVSARLTGSRTTRTRPAMRGESPNVPADALSGEPVGASAGRRMSSRHSSRACDVSGGRNRRSGATARAGRRPRVARDGQCAATEHWRSPGALRRDRAIAQLVAHTHHGRRDCLIFDRELVLPSAGRVRWQQRERNDKSLQLSRGRIRSSSDRQVVRIAGEDGGAVVGRRTPAGLTTEPTRLFTSVASPRATSPYDHQHRRLHCAEPGQHVVVYLRDEMVAHPSRFGRAGDLEVEPDRPEVVAQPHQRFRRVS
jgi:hypothetical protein